MSAPDAFALGGQQHGDDAILTLFREWRDGMERLAARNLPDDEYEPLDDALTEVQRQVFDVEASGLIGLAVKAFMLAYEVQTDQNYVRGDHQCSINAFDRDQYGAKRTLYLGSHALRGLVVDAVRFLPELAPLAARIIAAPVVLPNDGNAQAVGVC
jgi:hypothetical protein